MLPEFWKISEEIIWKSMKKCGLLKKSVTFYKKFKNQRQKGDFWNLSNIFQWLFKKIGKTATFWKIPEEVKFPTTTWLKLFMDDPYTQDRI